MSSPPTVSTGVTRIGRPKAIATLVVAFSADPVIRWVYPHTDRYLVHFPELIGRMGAPAFKAGTADGIGDDAGAALWVPPGQQTDSDGLVALAQRSIDPERLDAVFALLAQVEEHHPADPHWYLPFIGVDPRCQGQGHGSALMRQGLSRCARDGLPAYLEASSARNRSLYERHGFEVIAEIQVADSPPLWPMLRPAP
ncbi:MAG TPA: N-acetyltransferase [Egibacteraceae bacterium]|jgi:ribosomal protein S18 acetylase RimI-like enzyme|nr:N-acetyltransferase [Egibacteraceae bacterium]